MVAKCLIENPITAYVKCRIIHKIAAPCARATLSHFSLHLNIANNAIVTTRFIHTISPEQKDSQSSCVEQKTFQSSAVYIGTPISSHLAIHDKFLGFSRSTVQQSKKKHFRETVHEKKKTFRSNNPLSTVRARTHLKVRN